MLAKTCWQRLSQCACFELVEAITSLEKSSSHAELEEMLATWTEGNRSGATLEVIWTQSKRKHASQKCSGGC